MKTCIANISISLVCLLVGLLHGCAGSSPAVSSESLPPQQSTVSTAPKNLFVANRFGSPEQPGFVESFPADANGDTAGSVILNRGYFSVSFDSNGDMYASRQDSIDVFAPTTFQLIRQIAGPAAQLDVPISTAFDRAGNLFVANQHRARGEGSITIYPPGASGNVKPSAELVGDLTLLDQPESIALGPDGTLYVANTHFTFGSNVTIYGPGCIGNQPPTREILGLHGLLGEAHAIALATNGDIYVGGFLSRNSDSGYIFAFDKNANGDAAPVLSIGGPHTRLAGGAVQALAFDDAGELYAAVRVRDEQILANPEILVFPPGANGDVSPIRVIAGPQTLLQEPWGIALH